MAFIPWLGLRNCSFVIGVLYSVIALAVTSATLGYDAHVPFDDYASRGFNTAATIVSLMTFLSSLSLVYGIYEDRREFVSPWLVMQIVASLYTVVFYFWAVASVQERNTMGPVTKAVPEAAIFAAFHIVAMLGCIVVVHKQYQGMVTKSLLKYSKQVSSEYEQV
ncbi:uncharacterized protein [Anabrus simplex]|uniref:uncharacterized protein n=1 Tax=Anabrus simplex TaxID=316456 RepID=UPI0035A2B0F2